MAKFLDDLIDAGYLIPSGEPGLYGKSATFEAIVAGIDQKVFELGADQQAETLRFPPAITMRQLKESGYMKTLPHLAGTVHCFCGNEAEHRTVLSYIEAGDDGWLKKQEASNLAITPAACYPVYPVIAQRGTVPEQGTVIDVASYCFRHEPSIDPMRMQFFRMHEYVKFGTPKQVADFRAEWIKRGEAFIGSLLLRNTDIALANDPFFGRAGVFMAQSQREQELKYELLIPIEGDKPTACMSFNCHEDHFSEIWNIRTEDGNLAHTACVGFGMERITLALLKHHGLKVREWPRLVQNILWPV